MESACHLDKMSQFANPKELQTVRPYLPAHLIYGDFVSCSVSSELCPMITPESKLPPDLPRRQSVHVSPRDNIRNRVGEYTILVFHLDGDYC